MNIPDQRNDSSEPPCPDTLFRDWVENSPFSPARTRNILRYLIEEPFPFTEQQQKAVFATPRPESPILVQATPGSGKTSVLITRYILRLLQVQSASSILAVTYTRKAAREMLDRIQNRLQELSQQFDHKECKYLFEQFHSGEAFVTTFHSLSYQLLTEPLSDEISPLYKFLPGNYSADLQFIGKEQHFHWTEEILQRKDSMGHFSTENVIHTIRAWKVALISPSQAQAEATTDLGFISAQVFRLLRMRKQREGVVDYFDLIYLIGQLVRKNQKVRSLLSDCFDSVLIDEFQDTNPAQQLLVRKLCGQETTLYVVGDPHQSIFQWRGADSTYIKRFTRAHENGRRFHITKNFRSHSLITLTANELFHDRPDFEPMVPARSIGNRLEYGEHPRLFVGKDGKEERKFLAFIIQKLIHDQNRSASDIAVLVRTHSLKEKISDYLKREGIPVYQMGNQEFFGRGTTQAFISGLRWLLTLCTLERGEDSTSASLLESLRIWLVHPIGPLDSDRKDWLKKEVQDVSDWRQIHTISVLSEHERRRLRRCQRALKQIKDSLKSGAFLPNLRNQLSKLYFEQGNSVCSEYLRDCWHWLENTTRRDGIVGLKDLLCQFHLDQYDVQHINDSTDDGVWLGTLHAAKGLQFPVVFIPGIEEGWIPYQHHRLEKEKKIEEERRLLFVGMTRAQETLCLSYVRQRTVNDCKTQRTPSRFLERIPDEFLNVRYPPYDTISRVLRWFEPFIPFS